MTAVTAEKQNREDGNFWHFTRKSYCKEVIQYCQNKAKQKHLKVPIQKYKSGNRQINEPKISEVKGRGLSPELVT